MRQEFMGMESALREFIKQPDHPTLIINASDSDVAVPASLLNNWDREWDTHIFLLFPFECGNAGQYLDHCMQALAAQIGAFNQEQERTKEGADADAAWAPLPLFCRDPRQTPAKRMQAAVEHVRGLITDPVDIVWGVLPTTMGDAPGYRKMVACFLEGYQPWMDGHRFIVRDDRLAPALLPEMQRRKRDDVLAVSIDFSVENAANSLVETVNNPGHAMAERMQALSQLAALDLAYKRYPQALEKYSLLHAYHLESGDVVGQALALGGAGDVDVRRGQLKEAKERYQQALAVAAPSTNLMPTMNLLLAIGECCLGMQQFAEAKEYLQLASNVAGAMSSPFAKISAMENLGLAQVALGEGGDAVATWVAAKDLGKQFGLLEHCDIILSHLVDLHTRVGLRERAHTYRQERDMLKQQSLKNDRAKAESGAGSNAKPAVVA
jgi:tetratricopeptide (TPR) repeat protein